jgi:hypothetical protein
VVDAAKALAVSVGVETADDQRFEAAQRARGTLSTSSMTSRR